MQSNCTLPRLVAKDNTTSYALSSIKEWLHLLCTTQHATRMVTRLSLDMQSVNTSGCKALLLTVNAINNLFFYQHVFLVRSNLCCLRLQVDRRRKSYLGQSWFLLRTCASTCNQRKSITAFGYNRSLTNKGHNKRHTTVHRYNQIVNLCLSF